MANTRKNEASIAGSKSVILTSVICGLILIGVIVWAVATKSANALINKVAMTVGDKEISGVEFEYQYNEAISTFQTTYQDVIQYMGVDFEKDLSTQEYSEEQSWKDYFVEQAVAALTERYLLFCAADEAGYVLSDEDKKALDDEIASLKSMLSAYGISYSDYIKSIYGDEITTKLFRDYNLINTTAYNYYTQVMDSLEIDAAALEAYYNEHKDDIDTVDFLFYQFAYTVPTDVEEGDESYKDEAKAKADAALAAITDAASFNSAILAQLEDAETELNTEASNRFKDDMIAALSEWLYDGARVSGDKTVIEGNGGYFVLYFVERVRPDYEAVNVRHILISPEEVEDVKDDEGNVDADATAAAEEKAMADAKVKADEVLKQWLDGEKTEDSFAALAVSNSKDTGSAAYGGLYTHVLKGQMVEEFDSWIFDASREVGDYEIVETSYGYHIMFFSGNDGIVWEALAKSGVEAEEYEAYTEELEGKYEIVVYDEVIDLIG